MKIAVPTKNFTTISGHAGQTRKWLLYTLVDNATATDAVPLPQQIELAKNMSIHHFKDDGPHPLDGVDLVITFSAGDGFFRRMEKRGAKVILTGEADPAAAIRNYLSGTPQPKPPFDITTKFCKIHDLFSSH